MTGLNHALTGAAIGLAVQQPLLVLPLAILSHFVLDAIPHFDHEVYRHGSKYFMRIMICDGLLAVGSIIALMIFFPAAAWAVVLGALGATLPDFLWPIYYNNGRRKHWYFTFHTVIQWFERPPGLLVEASYLIFICVVLTALTTKG
jgi:hypothetical protein